MLTSYDATSSPDEILDNAVALLKSLSYSDRIIRLKNRNLTFLGRDAVEISVRDDICDTRQDALAFCDHLFFQGGLSGVTPPGWGMNRSPPSPLPPLTVLL
jgi:hypothetical protein